MEIIAFSNKKGGTGKTTSAINFCAALGRKGYKVLAIDLDPQANFTADSGGEAIGTVAGTFDFILGAPLEDVVQHNEYYDFMGADKRIENQRNKFEEKGSDFLLKKALAKVEGYDFVV
ncbi:AAA family ATPase, partial [Anaerovibrio lipolyticus]